MDLHAVDFYYSFEIKTQFATRNFIFARSP